MAFILYMTYDMIQPKQQIIKINIPFFTFLASMLINYTKLTVQVT